MKKLQTYKVGFDLDDISLDCAINTLGPSGFYDVKKVSKNILYNFSALIEAKSYDDLYRTLKKELKNNKVPFPKIYHATSLGNFILC